MEALGRMDFACFALLRGAGGRCRGCKVELSSLGRGPVLALGLGCAADDRFWKCSRAQGHCKAMMSLQK